MNVSCVPSLYCMLSLCCMYYIPSNSHMRVRATTCFFAATQFLSERTNAQNSRWEDLRSTYRDRVAASSAKFEPEFYLPSLARLDLLDRPVSTTHTVADLHTRFVPDPTHLIPASSPSPLTHTCMQHSQPQTDDAAPGEKMSFMILLCAAVFVCVDMCVHMCVHALVCRMGPWMDPWGFE